MPPYKLITGNSIEVMANAKAESVDAIVTDAPYALSFMGLDFDKPAEMLGTAIGISGGFTKFPPGVKRPEIKRNDPVMFQEWCRTWGVEALRVMKPGAYGVCFGATRTYHRLAAGLEDAGFEIRDTLMYLHGQGMPKGLNASKALRKIGEDQAADSWEGFNTQMKPAVEPIVLFQKPFNGTISQGLLEHGVGALNIDACRIGTIGSRNNGRQADSPIYGAMGTSEKVDYDRGRHPANVILDDAAAELLDAQSGQLTSGANPTKRGADKNRNVLKELAGQEDANPQRGIDEGGASRFFYKAKPSKAEKLAGVPEDLPKRMHETTKGLDLMRYLARLVTPPNGTILDCFLGSGTTGCAAMLEGFKFVGIEMSPEYMHIAEARMKHWNAVAEAGDE